MPSSVCYSRSPGPGRIHRKNTDTAIPPLRRNPVLLFGLQKPSWMAQGDGILPSHVPNAQRKFLTDCRGPAVIHPRFRPDERSETAVVPPFPHRQNRRNSTDLYPSLILRSHQKVESSHTASSSILILCWSHPSAVSGTPPATGFPIPSYNHGTSTISSGSINQTVMRQSF
ncbi:hypothetical protein D3C73_652670 [compost metagenome]